MIPADTLDFTGKAVLVAGGEMATGNGMKISGA
jgi:hypothetical protein